MYGKSATSMHKQNKNILANTTFSLSLAAVLIAVLGLFTPNANFLNGLLPNCDAPLSINSGVSYNGVDGVDGISAYAVWLNQGNTGDET